MEIPALFQTGIFLSAGAGILYALKSVPEIIFKKVKERLVYTAKVYQYDELYEALETWFFTYHRTKYRDVEAVLKERPPDHIIRKESDFQILYRQEENAFIINYEGKKLYIGKSIEKIDKAGLSIKEMRFKKWVISGIRAKAQVEKLFKVAAHQYFASRNENEVRVYTHYKHGDWYFLDSKKVKSIDQVIIDKSIKEEILNDLSNFLEDEEKYVRFGIPYKRSYLFNGEPGTGKTTLAMSLAHHLKRDVYYLSLSSFDEDSQLKSAFNGIKPNSILFIEDIDRVFKGRDNLESKISFSALLNNMDGALSKHGIITIITTNHMEHLDPALIRPGRADFIKRIPLAGPIAVSKYLSEFYDRSVNMQVPDESISMALVQEICIRNRNDVANAKKEIYDSIPPERQTVTKHHNSLHEAGES